MQKANLRWRVELRTSTDSGRASTAVSAAGAAHACYSVPLLPPPQTQLQQQQQLQKQHYQRRHRQQPQQQEELTMGDVSEGQLAVVSQLLMKLRSLRTTEAAGLARALGRRGWGPSPVSLEAFVDKCNRRLQYSGVQLQTGFDGEASAITLRSLPGLELPREDQQQKARVKQLHFMGDADVACAAELFNRILRTRAPVALRAFVQLCAEHRVPSAPQLLRWLLELRWVKAEAPVCATDGRQLTLGPSFYLDVLPRLDGWALPVCAICKQPAVLQAQRCSSCPAECHAVCIREMRSKLQQQEIASLTCCCCGAAWKPA
ncbi:hypothetical protein ACSSS7_001567 [Eimeria intestinalis]